MGWVPGLKCMSKKPHLHLGTKDLLGNQVKRKSQLQHSKRTGVELYLTIDQEKDATSVLLQILL